MFLKSTYSFFFSFLLFLLWSVSGTSRKVVSAFNSRAHVTSLLVIVFTCFLGSLLSSWLGSQKTWVFISLHRLQIRHSKILLILARPLPIGYFTFYYFSFFLIFNRMDSWSLMRSDAFIHFVCGSRRVNIRLGVLLLIPKSPQLFLFAVLLVSLLPALLLSKLKFYLLQSPFLSEIYLSHVGIHFSFIILELVRIPLCVSPSLFWQSKQDVY